MNIDLLVIEILCCHWFKKNSTINQNFNQIIGNLVTILSPEGKPIQVDANALQAAGVQNGIGMKDSMNKQNVLKTKQKPRIVNKLHYGIAICIYKRENNEIQVAFAEGITNFLGNKVTVMSADGKPVQVDASTLQAAQNTQGRIYTDIEKSFCLSENLNWKTLSIRKKFHWNLLAPNQIVKPTSFTILQIIKT